MTSLFLTATLLVLVIALPPGHFDGSGSVVGGLLMRTSRHGFVTLGPLFIVREGEGFRVVDVDTQSGEEAARRIMSGASEGTWMSVWSGDREFGTFWLATRRRVTRIDYAKWGPGGGPRPENLQELAHAVSDWIVQTKPSIPAWTIDDLRAGGAERASVVWSGVLLNALSVLVLGTWIMSFMWIPRAVRKNIFARRARPGLCVKCGYDLSGLSISRCPECGFAQDQPGEARESTRDL
jgi:hypothetical protein